MMGRGDGKIFFLMIQENQAILWDGQKNTHTSIPNSHSLPFYLSNKAGYECHILLDTVDQDFMAEKLPRISYIDRRRFLKTHLECRFGPDSVGRGAVRKTKNGFFLTGWRLLERDKFSPWVDVLNEFDIPIVAIKSIPYEWGKRSDRVSSHPTLVLNLDGDRVFRQWYYNDQNCGFSRTKSHQTIGLSDESWANIISHEIHLSLSYLMRQGAQISDLRVVIQCPKADQIHFPIHLAGVHSVIFNVVEDAFHRQIFTDFQHLKKDVLPYIPARKTNDACRRKLGRRGFYGAFAVLSMALLVEGWIIGSMAFSLYGDKKMARHLDNQIAAYDHKLSNEKPVVSKTMGIFLQNAWRDQSFFWSDGERLSRVLDESLHGAGYLSDYLWTHSPSDSTSTLAFIIVAPAGDDGSDKILEIVQKIFPNAQASIKSADDGELSPTPNRMIRWRVDLVMDRKKDIS